MVHSWANTQSRRNKNPMMRNAFELPFTNPIFLGFGKSCFSRIGIFFYLICIDAYIVFKKTITEQQTYMNSYNPPKINEQTTKPMWVNVQINRHLFFYVDSFNSFVFLFFIWLIRYWKQLSPTNLISLISVIVYVHNQNGMTKIDNLI